MTSHTDGLQVVIPVGTAFKLRHLVINLLGWSVLPLHQAGLAQPAITAQYALARLLPFSPIAALMATAAPLIGKLTELLVTLMRQTITRAITHQLATARVLAGARR